ncbi:MAG: enoyl-CoA hydratase/isomerase family protein [Chloroflexi bacterium]|nr:enoyl-CoA hydratase/isomerase family protein [Chloroflexota bacterium]
MEFKNILYEKKQHIAKITLNRPENLNAMDPTTYAEIYNSIQDIEEDRDVRVVVITGSGKAFCAGADLKAMQPALTKASWTVEFLESCHKTVNAVDNCTKPTIASVNGLTLAGGIELVEACDIIIASENAKFGDQHAARGLVPGGGGTQRLIRQMNYRKALELLLTGDWISAQEAYQYGFINKVVPHDQLEISTSEMAEKLALKSPMASRAIKMLAKKGIETDLSTALRMEVLGAAQHAFTDDFREGLKSFEERRNPDFSGN